MSPVIWNLASHTADTANFIFKKHFFLCWSLQQQLIFSSLWLQNPNREGSIGSNYRFRGRIHYGKRSRETQWGGSVSKDFHRARSQLRGVFRTYKQSTASEWSDMRLLTSQVFNSLWLEGIRQCFIRMRKSIGPKNIAIKWLYMPHSLFTDYAYWVFLHIANTSQFNTYKVLYWICKENQTGNLVNSIYILLKCSILQFLFVGNQRPFCFSMGANTCQVKESMLDMFP